MHEILGAAGRKMGPTGSRGGSAGVARPQLATAPPHVPPNQPPMQLPGFGAAPAAFPPLAAPPASEALLRWGKWVPPQAPAVAAMPGAQPGWYAPMPGFMPPGMLLPPAAFVVLPGAGGQQAPPAQEPPAEEPAPGGPPADASDSTATAEPGSPLAEAAPEGEGAAAGGAADSGATAPTEAAGMDAPAWEQDGNDGDDEAHPYYAPGAAPPPPHAVDVSASWPPYEGAKLPPLYKVGLAACGLMTSG